MTSAVELTSTVSNTHRHLHNDQKRWEKEDPEKAEPQLERENRFETRVECFEVGYFRDNTVGGDCTR